MTGIINEKFGIIIWVRNDPSKSSHQILLKLKCDCSWEDRVFSEEKLQGVILKHIVMKHDGSGKYRYKDELIRIDDGIPQDSNYPVQLSFIFSTEEQTSQAGIA